MGSIEQNFLTTGLYKTLHRRPAIKDLNKLNLVKFACGGLVLGVIQLAPGASKNDAQFKSGQKKCSCSFCSLNPWRQLSATKYWKISSLRWALRGNNLKRMEGGGLKEIKVVKWLVRLYGRDKSTLSCYIRAIKGYWNWSSWQMSNLRARNQNSPGKIIAVLNLTLCVNVKNRIISNTPRIFIHWD